MNFIKNLVIGCFTLSASAFAFTCNQEIAIVCTEGYIDGCAVPDDKTENGSLTTHHVSG